MALTRNQLNKFYEDRKPYLEEVIGLKFREIPTIWSQILNTKSAMTGWVDSATASGFGTFHTKAELEDAASDDILQGPVARTTIVTYAKRSAISQEAIEDDMGDGIIADRLPKMMQAARATQEILGHYPYNACATITTPDGVAFAHASHVNLAGGSYSNYATTALSVAGLEAAITQMRTQQDDRGNPIYQVPAKLLVPPSLEWTAKVILNSAGNPTMESTNYPHSAAEFNPVAGVVQLVVSPYLTDDTNWFLLADQIDANWRWRIQPENWSEPNYRNSSVEVGMRWRSAVEILDPRSIMCRVVAG